MKMQFSDTELNQVSDVIAALDEENFNELATEALADLIGKVQDKDTKGTLTIKLVVEPLPSRPGQVEITGEYQMAPPKHVSKPTRMRSNSFADQLALFQWVEEKIVETDNDNAIDVEIISEDKHLESAPKQLTAV